MKSLIASSYATKDSAPEKHLAALFMDAIPRAMLELRIYLRFRCKPSFNIMQYRILRSIQRQPKTNKELADQIGGSVAAMSRAVQKLVNRGFVRKTTGKEDRRQNYLDLTPKGRVIFNEVLKTFHRELSEKIRTLEGADQGKLEAGFDVLLKLFPP